MFSEARAALAVVEDTLSSADVLRAAELISTARQVMIFGLGGSSTALAQEVQNRLFRYGVVAYAHADPYVLKMSAATLDPAIW